jgi:hypothetical protein
MIDFRVKARIGVVDHKSTSGGEEPTEDPVVTHTLEKTKKVISTGNVLIYILPVVNTYSYSLSLLGRFISEI